MFDLLKLPEKAVSLELPVIWAKTDTDGFPRFSMPFHTPVAQVYQ